jgi:uncharacterized protein YdcH (DUF465 family)
VSRTKGLKKNEPARRSELELQELKKEIDKLKSEMNRLIESNASFDEIYSVSTKLDRLIVILLKNRPGMAKSPV